MASVETHCLLLESLTPRGFGVFNMNLTVFTDSRVKIAHLKFLPTPDQEPVAYAGEHTWVEILRIVNSVWEKGLFATFSLLPAVITVQSPKISLAI
jgi:hypothetical protein